MPEIIIEKALPSDNKEICDLCKVPMDGNISMSLGIDPDCFINAGIQNQEIELFVCRQSKRVIGMFSVGKRTVFYNSKPKLIRYFSDLRIHPDFQKSLLLIKITRFIKTNIIKTEEFVYSIVFSDNKVMTDMIAKVDQATIDNRSLIRRASLPRYSLCGTYHSYMVSLKSTRKIKKSNLIVKKAEKNDIESMQSFFNREAHKKQWYPFYNFSVLKDNYYHGLNISDFYLAFKDGEIVGITGIWDQRRFKQTYINSYARSLKLLRPLINIVAKFTKGFNLPETGKVLKYFTLHTILIKDNNQKIFKDIVENIYKDNCLGEFSYFLCGLDKNDTLCNIFNGFKKRVVNGNVYSVSFDYLRDTSIPSNYYFEAARI